MWKSVAIGAFLILLVVLTFLPRLLSLSSHWSSDEVFWMVRSRNFFFALQTQQFENTYVSHHPGVTTTWLGSVAIWNKYRHDPASKSWFYSDMFLTPEMLANVRFPIALVAGILILVSGILLYRLFGNPVTAGLGTLFLAVEPFLLAESRRAHTDVLTSLFLFLSLLLWLCYLERESLRCRDIIFSGICFGMACLTKSLAGAFLLFLPFLLGWYIIQRGVHWVRLIWSALLWMMVTLLTIGITWPYLWTVKFKLGNLPVFPILFIGCGVLLIWSHRKLSTHNPSSLTRSDLFVLGYGLFITAGALLSTVTAIVGGMYWALTEANWIPTLFLGEILYNPGPLYFPVMWFVWSMPLTFPLIGVAMYRAWQQRDHEKRVFRVVVVLILFVLFYLIGLSIVAKKISRYIVIFLPAVSALSVLGAIQVAQLFKKKATHYLFLIAVVILQIVPILRLHPYYRTYYYPLLSGKWVAANTGSITGAGLDLAADYLNTLPKAQDLKIRLSQFSTDLSYYFIGKTSYSITRYVGGDSAQETNTNIPRNFDYEVEYLYDRQIHGVPVDPSPTKDIQYEEWQPSQESSRELRHVIRLNGIDYVWIYRILSEKAP